MIFGREEAYYQQRHAGNTAREINQQPAVWRQLADSLADNGGVIRAYMERVLAIPGLRIVFTGAGSSAFVGESLQLLLANELGIRSENVHTTDIVATPRSVLYNVPTLLVSFSRSGESPESVGALKYARRVVDELYNLVVVCKEDSSLSRYAAEDDRGLVVNMPPESSDAGFAMTSSVSCMALATWCLFAPQGMAGRIGQIRALADAVEGQMQGFCERARTVAAWDYNRAVFLGSGALRGLARESAIKTMELTDGLIHSSYDTPTGFRHGPKTMVNGDTLSVHYISPLAHTRRYDLDFLTEMVSEKRGNRVVAVAEVDVAGRLAGADMAVTYPALADAVSEELTAYVFSLVFAQLLSFEKSMALGYNTDSPCAGGQVNRVVQGVTIYEFA